MAYGENPILLALQLGVKLSPAILTAYTYAANASLTGLSGVFAAALITGGTSMASGLFALGGAAVGGGLGYTAGKLKGDAGEAGLLIGAIICGIGGSLCGAWQGYGYATDIIIDDAPTKTTVSEIMSEEASKTQLIGQSLDSAYAQEHFPNINVAGLQFPAT